MATHNEFGKKAEDRAAGYLQENGYKILIRNFRFQKAEIDIIAEKDDLIIIAEVKARSTDVFLLPEETVTKSKIRLIVSATDHYLKKFNRNSEVRFDIISVLPDKNNNLIVNYIENAFEALDAN